MQRRDLFGQKYDIGKVLFGEKYDMVGEMER